MSQKEKGIDVNFKYLNTLFQEQLLIGISKNSEKDFMECRTCIENIMHNIPFEIEREKAKDLLEIIHTDVYGPFETTDFRREKYFISFIDDYS